MLFNDAGFVRFRMGPDGGTLDQQQPQQQVVVLRQSSQNNLNQDGGGGDRSSSARERLRASQSFDDSVSANYKHWQANSEG